MSPDHQPQILWQAHPSIGPNQLRVTTLIHDKPRLHPEVQAAIEEKAASKKIARNGTLASLVEFESSATGLHITTGLTNYVTQVGINANYQDPRISRHPDSLRHGSLVLSALVISSDGFIVLGNRPMGKDHTIPGIIGGTANRDEKTGPLTEGVHYFNLINSEVEEELGVHPDETLTALLALLINPLSGRPLLLFLSKSSLSKSQVSQRFSEGGNKAEHESLYFLPADIDSVKAFLKQHPSDLSTTLATIDALSFYLLHYEQIRQAAI